MSNKNFPGSIELISGITPKNNGDFPLIDAEDVIIYDGDDDAEGMRLPDKLKNVGISAEEKQQLVTDAVSATQLAIAEDLAQIDTNKKNIASHSSQLQTQGDDISGIKNTLKTLEKDNKDLYINYTPGDSTLSLYTKNADGDTDLGEAGKFDFISSTIIVAGGGSGSAATYKLSLKVDPDSKENFSILQGQEVKLKYQIKLSLRTDELDDKGNYIYQDITNLGEKVTFKVYKNNVFQTTLTETLKSPKGEIDVTDLATIGNNNFKVVASVVEYPEEGDPITTSSTAYWGVDVITMSLITPDSLWEAQPKYGTAAFSYTARGALEKTVYFKLNGELVHQQTILASEYSDVYTITPTVKHGVNTLEVYCEGSIEGETISTDVYKYVLLFIDTTSIDSLIRIKANDSLEQYSSMNIYFNVFDPQSASIAEVKIYEDDVLKTTLTNITSSEQKWEYKPTVAGEKTIKIEYLDKASESVTVNVTAFPHLITPASPEWLQVDFSPIGRSNQDADYNIFKNSVTAYVPEKEGDQVEMPVDWTLSENFDWINGGWKTDANGDSYFCIKAGTYVDINYPLFATNNTVSKKTVTSVDGSSKTEYSAGSGKEMKIVFKTANVADVSSTWLECMAPAANAAQTGIKMNIHEAFVNSNLDSLRIPYSEEDIIEFDMNITPVTKFTDTENGIADLTTKDIPMVMTYEDGTPVQPKVITNTSTSFKQEVPVPIHIGSEHCDVHIYRLKIYERFLSEKEIINNFIADARSGAEMATRFLRNQIYMTGSAFTGQEADLEFLAKACPNLRVFLLSAPKFTIDKDDKVKNTTFKQWYYGAGEESPYHFWTATNGVHRGQGTSSNKYGYSGRNLDFDMKKATITLADGSVVSKVPFTDNSVPTNYMNFKINIASSENGNNAILANRYNRFLPYTPYAQIRDPKAKNTMEFHNCVVFIQETDTDLSKHTAFSDSAIHFYGIGNIGDSKKTDSTRTSDPDDENEFCVEVLDWNLALSAFPTDPHVDAKTLTYTENNETYYYFYNDESLQAGLLKELIDGEYVVSLDETINPDKTYYIDMLENEDFSGDFTYEFRYITEYDEDDELPAEELAANKAHNKRIQGKAKQIWTDFYKFLTRDLTTNGVEDSAKIAAWKEEFKEWFILDAALYYYLFTLRYTMVDNRAKNSFYHYGKVGEDAEGNPIYKFDFWDYDNDTSLGIDNAGKLEMDYGVEDLDTDALGNLLFRAGNSTFFTRVAKYFSSEIQQMWHTLENSEKGNAFSSQGLINEFDTWQSQFPEELWRLDYERRYKRTYVGGTGVEWDNALPKVNADGTFTEGGEIRFLNDMMNGKKKYQRRQFDRNQDFYMSSKFVSLSNQNDFMQFRGAGAGAEYDPPQDPSLTITPYLNMYVNLHDGTKVYFSKKLKAGESYGPIPYGGAKLDILNIYGASNIQSLGDTSLLYPQTAALGTGKRLKSVILGNDLEGFKNPVLENLDLGVNNRLLEVLDIRNVVGLKGDLSAVTQIPSLKYLYAQGTNCSSVKFANNGLLREAYLPASLTTLECKNLFFLEKLEIESYENLVDLVIENCDLNTQAIVEASNKLKTVRINNIDWTLTNANTLERLYNCLSFNEDGSHNNEVMLTGKINIKGTITRYNLEKYQAAWANSLTITVDPTDGYIQEQQWVYWYSDASTSETKELIASFLVNRGETLETERFIGGSYVISTYDPTVEGNLSGLLVDKPKKPNSADGQYTYSFIGWDKDLQSTTVGVEDIYIYAQQKAEDRYYRVEWLNGDGTVKGVHPAVKYGTSIIYEDAIAAETENVGSPQKVAGVPIKNPLSSIYYIFSSWDKSTAKIIPEFDESINDFKDTIVMTPQFKSSDALYVPGKINRGAATTGTETLVLQPEDLYAVAKNNGGNAMNSYVANSATGVFGASSVGKDLIEVQLGYMPHFNNVEDQVLAENLTLNGSNLVATDVYPFAADQSFTLAIDFTSTYNNKSGNTYLMSAYSTESQSGMNLVAVKGGSSRITWGSLDNGRFGYVPKGISNKAPKESVNMYDTSSHFNPLLSHREICVIRKLQGDSKLYIYTNNRYSLDDVQMEAIDAAINPILEDTYLVFGDRTPTTGGTIFKENGKGIIHYAKIWWDDIGDNECRKICNWTYNKMQFKYNNTFTAQSTYVPRYNYDEKGTQKCVASFLAAELLPEMMQYMFSPNIDNSTDPTSDYYKTDLQKWLTTKFIKAFPIEWQQVIQPVHIPVAVPVITSQGVADHVSDTPVSEAQILYLPSVAEIDNTMAGATDFNSSPYYAEYTYRSPAYSAYAPYINDDSRIYKLPGTDIAVKWALRSRMLTDLSRGQFEAVTCVGTTNQASYVHRIPGTVNQTLREYHRIDALYGILVGFSI